MKKIGILTWNLGRGGAERVSVQLSEYLKRQGRDVVLITNSRTDNEYQVPQCVKRICLTDGAGDNKLYRFYCMIKRLHHLLKWGGFDVLLIMRVSPCVYAIPAAVGTKVPLVISERNDPRQSSGMIGRVSHWMMKWGRAFVFQTNDAQAYYRQRWLNEKKSKVIFNPLSELCLPPVYEGVRRKMIVSVGRLQPQKNHHLLLEAFASIEHDFKEVRLCIWGEGDLRHELELEAKALGISEKVVMPGNVSDVLEHIKSAGLFVMSSDYEGMPNALMEAMALGLPCIATDCPCGGPRALIRDGINGLLVPVGDEKAMAMAIRRLLMYPAEAEQLGANAVKIRERLSIEKIGRQWLDFLQSVC